MPVVGRLDKNATMIAKEFDDYSMSENLFLYSEQFDVIANWAVTNSTITPNTSIAPDKTLTADTITDNATTGTHVVSQGSINVTSALNYTLSCFVKKNTARYARLALGGTAMTFNSCVFDLDTSTFVVGTGSFKSFGNGWYRISASSTAASTGIATFSIGISNATNTGYSGIGDTLLIWGAQIEQSSVATDYTPTTTITRTRVLPSTTNINITASGIYYSSGFSENVGAATTLATNVFPPYDTVNDEFVVPLFGPGQGTYMRQNNDKSVTVYNEIDEITII